MTFQQKVQYKLKNFLYEQERKKGTKGPKNIQDNPNHSSATKVTSALQEIDEYIGEKMQHIPVPKIKKNE